MSQDDVSKNLSHSVKSSNEELIDVFDFIIHHSGKREWAIASFRDESEGKMYGMVQGKIGASVASPSSIDGLDESNMIAKIHTHEGYIQEHGASGDYNGPLALHVTDKRNYENMLERSKNLHFPMPRHYVYEAPYRSLYQYNEKRGDIFRGKYNSNLFIQILR